MATKAPRPGGSKSSKNAEAQRQAQRITRISFKDSEPLSLAIGVLPIWERMEVRRQLRAPLEDFWSGIPGTIGADSFAVLWWLARRANGEPNLSFFEVADDMAGATTSDFTLAYDDGTEAADDPEG